MSIKNRRYFLGVFVTALLLATIALYSMRTPELIDKSGTDEETGIADHTLKIITFNTEYWHDSESELMDAFSDHQYDFILFQEHLKKTANGYTSTNRVNELKEVIGDRFVNSNGEVVTVSRYPSLLQKNFGNGTAMRTDYQLTDNKILSIYNVHMPVHLHLNLIKRPLDFIKDAHDLVGVRRSLKDQIINDIKANKNNVLVGGDFNTTIGMNTVDWFRENMIDAYSSPNCKKQYGTWEIGNVLSWRIDYVFSSRSINPLFYCTVDLPEISDHKAIVSSFNVGERK